MVTLPTEVGAGVVEQAKTPAVPFTVQSTVPAGAVAPAVPVTVAVNIKVELRAPLPEPVRTMVGVAFAMKTEIGVV